MRKNNLNGKPGQQSASNGHACAPGSSTPPSVAVLNEFPLYNDPESISCQPEALSLEEENLKLFKVFMKRNLPAQKPAPDLLVRIHRKIDAVREEMDN